MELRRTEQGFALYKEKDCIGECTLSPAPKGAQLTALCILPRWRRKGYGSYLLKEVLRSFGGYDREAATVFPAPLPENAAELAKLEADKAAAAEKLSGEGVSGSNSSSQATNTNTTIDTTVNNANTGSSDYDSFINEWTSRIDNYLAGSPMAGQGYNFAVAAWNTGVDPRWSPAIACIESTKGAYCANSYNAWGWSARGGGWRRFGSWSEGISAHVAYLGANYGSTLTPAAAKKYCPPTWQDWYNKVAAQMNRI